MAEDWLSRWEQGRIGWHEASGNAALKRYWPELARHSRVLVPLCGKSPDLLWLANRSLDVIGVELSELAVRAFFEENGLAFTITDGNGLRIYRGDNRRISIYCGDYFTVSIPPCDALYDRGSLVALPASERARYARHTDGMLKQDAARLVITLEYDQDKADGPPFSVRADEIKRLWPCLECLSRRNDIENCPPKFREAGLTEVTEAVWATL